MKKFRKLTIALLAICVFAISVTACGPQKTATQVEAEAVEAIREQNIASIQDYTEREFAAILTQVSYENYAEWNQIVHNAMATDFSWTNSAKEYKKLYEQLANK